MPLWEAQPRASSIFLGRERAQVSGGEGSQLLCILEQRASRGGCVEAPTTATPGVAWGIGSGMCQCPEWGCVSPGGRAMGMPCGAQQTLCGRHMGTVSEWQYSKAEVPKSRSYIGPQTLSRGSEILTPHGQWRAGLL